MYSLSRQDIAEVVLTKTTAKWVIMNNLTATPYLQSHILWHTCPQTFKKKQKSKHIDIKIIHAGIKNQTTSN